MGLTFEYMMKQPVPLRLLFGALVFVAACKPDAPASSAGSAADQPSGKARSAKIDLKPASPPPSLPSSGADPAAPSSSEEAPPPRGMRADMTPEEREEMRKRRLERFDKDGDGKISEEERTAAMKQRMDNLHARLDTDGDGKLSPAELSAGRAGRMLPDGATLDANHDGDISADELAAGMKTRRDERRALRDGSAGSGAQGTPPTAGSSAQ